MLCRKACVVGGVGANGVASGDTRNTKTAACTSLTAAHASAGVGAIGVAGGDTKNTKTVACTSLTAAHGSRPGVL